MSTSQYSEQDVLVSFTSDKDESYSLQTESDEG